ncbi:AfsR/SARP family transcriptional regulator [Streptomyces sp. GbtcB6]|uniref:AfsR/SARP family transcriptional regulator n=1 Tax=Streptomyces sp. GbtcB6 TaxID=2824751 RepID=UPI0027E3E103|nr:AfsR/SARP family transcriptional regulator [Streptomyces sp. GbtcB6]
MFTFSILGTIEIQGTKGAVRVSGIVQQTLLTAFLAGGEEVITVDALIDELWGTTPPAKVENALQAQVSRLRRCLERAEPGRVESRLTKRAAGYRFAVEPKEVDALTFLHTIDAVRAGLDSDLVREFRSAVEELRNALALWREPLFGGIAGGPICRMAADRYREARSLAHALLYEFELRDGAHARVLPEIRELYAQNPFNEQYCMMLMTALYRTGRQTDALDVYRRLRESLDQNFGLEPSPVLRRFERAILLHDPSLLAERLPFATGAIPVSARGQAS